ncbi:MAG: hypothetical protein L0332_14440 [Chloroflexi bacterium]|nr:hypothetical protein [Chloroflexota bacterium]MCI0575544.1 hypothetical protein [Chloroflexota bacterium]MCI0644084.1 hypothetical protein [Chloroflexota bacterium]MCI0727900.1 hypothetical protein [Chloroflexota bacterium]
MKQTATIAFLLTFLALLLVLSAAIVFLSGRNETLQDNVAVAQATSTQLASEVTVRNAALDSANATRDDLATQSAGQAGQLGTQNQEIQALNAQLELQATILAQAEQTNAVNVLIFSPKDGTTVRPGESLELVIAANAPAGVAGVTLTVNDEAQDCCPGENQLMLLARPLWTPPAEGTYTITAVAKNSTGQTSQPSTVTVTASYASDEEREAALLQEVAQTVIEIRGPVATATATATPSPEPGGTAPQNFGDLHQNLMTGDAYTRLEAENEALVLSAFDYVPAGYDLFGFVTGLVTNEVTGYYAPESNSFFAYQPGEVAEPFGQWSQVHTVTHEIQVERFALDELNLAGLNEDNLLAVRALVEGEANLVQSLYLQGDYLAAEEVEAINAGLASAGTGLLDGAPAFLGQRFQFAYSAGANFVQFFYGQAGFPAVDDVWARLPASTEQILHPEKYQANEPPQPVTLLPLNTTLGVGWQLIGQDVFGEFYLRQYLAQHLPPDEVDQAATGWGGGRYAVYWNEADQALMMALRLAWDTPADHSEFATALTDYLGLRFEGAGQLQPDGGRCWQGETVICFYQLGGHSLVVRAPSLEIAAAVAAAQGNTP